MDVRAEAASAALRTSDTSKSDATLVAMLPI